MAGRKGITWLANNDPQTAEYMYGSSAAQPVGRKRSYRLVFYNLGWDQASKKHSSERLADEVLLIIRSTSVHAMGICEVYNLKADKFYKARQDRRLGGESASQHAPGTGKSFRFGRACARAVSVMSFLQ